MTSLVASGAVFGYDVMVHVGIARLQRHRSAEEVIAELAAQNVVISASEVRNLTERFATYLGIAHRQAGPAIADHLMLNGGYILHLDSTSRVNSRKLMTGIDELSGLVLLNVRLTSETAENVTDFLRTIIQSYGKPLAIASDMAASIRSAITTMPELTNVPHFICHFHFLRDAGKDLMQEEYRRFEDRLESHGASRILREFRRSMEPQLAGNRPRIDAYISSLCRICSDDSGKPTLPQLDISMTAALLAESALQSRRQADGYGFPFDRPALTYYEHLLRVADAIEALRSRHGLSKKEKRLLARIGTSLQAMATDRILARMAAELRARSAIFDNLRSAMRLAPVDAKDGLNHPGADSTVDMADMEQEVKKLRDHLDVERPEMRKLQEQIDRHWHGLFHKPITAIDSQGNERTIYPQRTNNLLEQYFRAVNHRERRRTGVELSAARFDAIPVDSFFTCNLNVPAYYAIILNGAADLSQRFSRIDPAEVRHNLENASEGRSTFASPRRARKTLATPSAPCRIALDELAHQLEILELKHNIK